MRTHRSGFTLVELIVVMIVGTMLLGAAYQALISQQRGYRTTGAVIGDQDALRIALGVLEAEIRETAAIGGLLMGGSDIVTATPDSVRLRAPRKIALVCSVSPSEKSMIVWSEWEMLSPGDSLLIFVDNLEDTYIDDRWEVASVSNVNNTTASCDTRPPGAELRKVIMVAHPLTGVLPGAPVRAFEPVTYGLYEIDGEWGLGRKKNSDEAAKLLVGGLAGPGEGLILEYLNTAGATTADPAAVASIRVSLTTADQPSSGTQQKSVTSTIYLRNN